MKKTTLVIGASTKPERYSYKAIHKLIANNIDVKAISVKKGAVSGVIFDTNLKPYKNIHTVSLYINPKLQKEYYNYILRLQPKRVIFNPGTENNEFYNLLQENNIDAENACTLVLLATNQY